MKKKYYYILLVSLATFLVVSIITIGILSTKLLKNKDDEAYYKIGEAKIESIAKVVNADLDCIGYSYTNDSDITFAKTYVYKATNITNILVEYNEYLMFEQGFEQVASVDMSQVEANYSLTKIIEESSDVFEIEISYDATNIEIELSYTYCEK